MNLSVVAGVAVSAVPAIALMLAVGFFALMFAAQAADDAMGCGSVDPTDPGNYSEVFILNDTARAVIVDQCHGAYCDPEQDPTRLAPHQRIQVAAACASSGADMTSWRASSTAGLLGYIAVDTPRKHDGLTYRVSRASRSRVLATPPGPRQQR